jgi:hypothetical protein
MNKKAVGTLVSLAYVLHGAAEPFSKPEVGGWKLRRQAAIVMKHCLNAIGSIGGLVLVDRDGHREVCDTAKRQAQRTLDEFVSVAGLHMQRRDFYTPAYVAARMMACRLAIDDAIVRHGLPKEWRKLESVTATMLGMLVHDMPEDEARMYRVAESFTERVAA